MARLSVDDLRRKMKRAIRTVLVCFALPCCGEAPDRDPGSEIRAMPNFERRDSPVTLLKQFPDGTLLVSLRPKIYLDESGCIMVSDGAGSTFSIAHYVIAFSLKKTRYWTILGTNLGEGPPVRLDSEKEYRCLIKISGADEGKADRLFSILEIWDGVDLIYERKYQAVEQDGADQPAPESKPEGDPKPQ